MAKTKMRPQRDFKSKKKAQTHAQYLRHTRQKQTRVTKIKGGYRVSTGARLKRRHLKGKPNKYEP